MLIRFYLIPEGNGQTNGQTDRFAISISRVSMLTRNKNVLRYQKLQHMLECCLSALTQAHNHNRFATRLLPLPIIRCFSAEIRCLGVSSRYGTVVMETVQLVLS